MTLGCWPPATPDELAHTVVDVITVLAIVCVSYAVGLFEGARTVRKARSRYARRLEIERDQLSGELKEARRELMRMMLEEERVEEDITTDDVFATAFAALESYGMDYCDARLPHDQTAVFIDANGEPHEFWRAGSPGSVNVVIAVRADRLPEVTNDMLERLDAKGEECVRLSKAVLDGEVGEFKSLRQQIDELKEECERLRDKCRGLEVKSDDD